MVRVSEDGVDLGHVDFSVIPSLECDLECSFCMYCSGPSNLLRLDIDRFKTFLKTVDWGRVTSWGFYGGEPSVDPDRYGVFADLIPEEIRKFLITNGHWTVSTSGIRRFFRLCTGRKFRVVISGTPEHKANQHRTTIENLSHEEGVIVKGDDDMHPMGRLASTKWSCTEKCLWHQQPIRLAVFPTGDVIFQNCDGVYPVVGPVELGFDKLFDKALEIRTETCFANSYATINDVLKDLDLIGTLDS